MSTLTIPEGYGHVALVSAGLLPVLAFLHGFGTTKLRIDAKIPYPNAYATEQQMKANPAAYRFNCAVRAHANLMENLPQTMVMLLVGGLSYPTAAAVLGYAWALTRSIYWVGYVYSSKKRGDGRLYGAVFWFVQGGIWALGLSTGWALL